MTADNRRRASISEEDRALWQAVARTIKPLKRRRTPAEAAPLAAKPKPEPRQLKAATRATTPSHPVAILQRTVEPPLTPLARKEQRRLSRGTADIDARLDLHGRTQAQAHVALLRFLRKAQTDGAKTVLVITGKGGESQEGERGVLRRQVPLWLALPDFRNLVVGFSGAGSGHGGDGALYVRIRRPR